MALGVFSLCKGGSKPTLRPLQLLCAFGCGRVSFPQGLPTLSVSLAGLRAQKCSLVRSTEVIFSGAHTQDYGFEKGGNTGAWLKGTH